MADNNVLTVKQAAVIEILKDTGAKNVRSRYR